MLQKHDIPVFWRKCRLFHELVGFFVTSLHLHCMCVAAFDFQPIWCSICIWNYSIKINKSKQFECRNRVTGYNFHKKNKQKWMDNKLMKRKSNLLNIFSCSLELIRFLCNVPQKIIAKHVNFSFFSTGVRCCANWIIQCVAKINLFVWRGKSMNLWIIWNPYKTQHW